MDVVKDSESRAECKTNNEVFVFIPEAHPTLDVVKGSETPKGGVAVGVDFMSIRSPVRANV